MRVDEVRKRYLEFFKKRGHAVIPSVSLVPENDPTTLFISAGMQPLVPYLLGQPHPAGKRLVDIQKCVRTGDIDEVGDNTHLTFFEMLGNWSLGDYFKKDAIQFSYDLLTNKDEGFGLDLERLYITVFEGDENAPRDIESAKIWEEVGVPKNRIYFLPASKNWWSAGEVGPCGPDTEMYYDVTENGLGDLTHEQFLQADEKQQVVEIWNDVFMEFNKQVKPGKQDDYAQLMLQGKEIPLEFYEYLKLPKQNVDTGAGLERFCMVLQKKKSVFDIDVFEKLIDEILRGRGVNRNDLNNEQMRAVRIVADHMRASVFLAADGVSPGNKGRDYVLRRLLRRAIAYLARLDYPLEAVERVILAAMLGYEGYYKELAEQHKSIIEKIKSEVEKFALTLQKGQKELSKILETGKISGTDAFNLYQTFGYPWELTHELATQKGFKIDKEEFESEFKRHQDLSRTASAGTFKGGLADTSEKTIRLHTTHHLLLKALQIVLGPDVKQRGSNITSERLRIDFSHDAKMTDEQKKEVEKIVNEKIAENLPVIRSEILKEEAEKLGAEHEFGQKYPDRVSVYSVGPKGATQEDPQFEKAFSIEFCGGPHVTHTGEIKGTFKIQKEEASSAGIRRIKGVID